MFFFKFRSFNVFEEVVVFVFVHLVLKLDKLLVVVTQVASSVAVVISGKINRVAHIPSPLFEHLEEPYSYLSRLSNFKFLRLASLNELPLLQQLIRLLIKEELSAQNASKFSELSVSRLNKHSLNLF